MRQSDLSSTLDSEFFDFFKTIRPMTDKKARFDNEIGLGFQSLDYPDTVEIAYLTISGVRKSLAKLDLGPYEFDNGKTDSEKIHFYAYDELLQTTIPGMCVLLGELVVDIKKIALPTDRVFLVDGVAYFGEREARLGYPFPREFLRSVAKAFFPSFVQEMQEYKFLFGNQDRVKNSRAILSSDFSRMGLEFLRRHYHQLCLNVLQQCSNSPESNWGVVVNKLLIERFYIWDQNDKPHA